MICGLLALVGITAAFYFVLGGLSLAFVPIASPCKT